MWDEGGRLNLERALKVGDELGGHIVTGHVDGVGEIDAVLPVGDSTRLTLIAGDEVAPYLAAKGSVALDGVSLTVNDVENLSDGVRFTVNNITPTASATTLAGFAAGAKFTFELHILARLPRRTL